MTNRDISHAQLNAVLNRDKKILYIDMDKVMCDFEKRYSMIREKFPYIQYPQSQYGFFSRLEPIDGALAAINQLESKYDIWFLTRPSYMNIHCYSEKAEWILEHLGSEYQQKMIIMPNKSMAIGHYLVDDSLNDGQTEFIGEHIHFGSYIFQSWNDVTSYLLNDV